MIEFQSKLEFEAKNQESQKWKFYLSLGPMSGEDPCSSSKTVWQREDTLWYSAFPIQTLRGLDESHPHWWGHSVLLSLQFSVDLLQKHSHLHPHNNAYPNVCSTCSPVKLRHQVNHRKSHHLGTHSYLFKPY